MTDIPGTSKLSLETDRQKATAQVISSVNVQELKKLKKEGPPKPQEKFWYNKLTIWILAGLAASALFSLLAFVNLRFLLLTPLGPTVATAAWFVRRYVTRYEEKTKGFFK